MHGVAEGQPGLIDASGQRIVLSNLRHHLMRHRVQARHHLGRKMSQFNAVARQQGLQGDGIAVEYLRRHARGLSRRRQTHDGLQVCRQGQPSLSANHQRVGGAGLVHAWPIIILGHLVKSEGKIRIGRYPFCRVDDTGL